MKDHFPTKQSISFSLQFLKVFIGQANESFLKGNALFYGMNGLSWSYFLEARALLRIETRAANYVDLFFRRNQRLNQKAQPLVY